MIYKLYKKQVEAWKEEFDHLAVSNLLRESDPIYGEENRQAKQQLKSSISSSRHKDTIELIEAEIKRKRGLKRSQRATYKDDENANDLIAMGEDRGYNSAIDENIAYLEEELRKLKNEQ